jgi:hypothetical protein
LLPLYGIDDEDDDDDIAVMDYDDDDVAVMDYVSVYMS